MGGVPQLIRFDGGRDFLAHAVKRAAGELGRAALPAAPYSPHHKGKVERLHRTIGEGLISTLPHYTGGPRRANSAGVIPPRLACWCSVLRREAAREIRNGRRP